MHKSIWALIPALPGLLIGCKVEITSPETGSVASQSGGYTCAAGQSCSIDVNDVHFDETFVALPAEGFTFKEWKQKPRHFCSGRKAPCRLFTSAFEGVEVLEEFLAGDQVFYLEPVFRSCQGEESLAYEVASITIADPGLSCFSKGDSVRLNAVMRDAAGNRLPSNLIVWRSTNNRIARVDSTGLVTARKRGKVQIEASYKYDCENRYSTAVPVSVLDLTGQWTITEVADERDCDEGVNTYTMQATMVQNGNNISFTTELGAGSGTLSGCRITGLSRELEDEGITYSEGSAIVSPNGKMITAQARWDWQGGDPREWCSGTSNETYIRN